jgi:hypothetical protein
MSSSFRARLAIFFVLFVLVAARPARADTYKVTIVDFTQNENFLGIDDKGDFVVNDTNNSFKCGFQNGLGPCFEVFLLGQATSSRPRLRFLVSMTEPHAPAPISSPASKH